MSVFLSSALSLAGCSSDDARTGAAGAAGAAQSELCEPGTWRRDDKAACEPAGVSPSRCADGFVSDGEMGCSPVLPATACASGTIAILGDAECHPVGVHEAQCSEGFSYDGTGSCEPILPIDNCPVGTFPEIGSTTCEPVGGPVGGLPGVAPNSCASGFVHDGDGSCQATLPTTPCAPGEMAIPGETVCRPVMTCGVGTWGDIPVEANTLYADASYDGGSGASDGSAIRPFVSMQAAIDAAPSGAIVAVAAGTYAENVSILHKKIRLWGVCPSSVSLVGDAQGLSTINIYDADGSEIHGIGVSGTSQPGGGGVGIYASKNVLVDRVWVHDYVNNGVYVRYDGGPASAVVQDSLVEGVSGFGSLSYGASASFRRSVVRETKAAVGGASGVGIFAVSYSGSAGTLSLESCVVAKNMTVGVGSNGVSVTIDASVISDTLPNSGNGAFGRGVDVEPDTSTMALGSLVLKRSQISRNANAGIYLGGASGSIEDTTIEDTLLDDSGVAGVGLRVEDGGAAVRSNVSIARSTFRRSIGAGMTLLAVDLNMQDSVVQDTSASPSTNGSGVGILAARQQELVEGDARVSLLRCTIERNTQSAIVVQSSSLTLDHVVIRDTLPNSTTQLQGDGVVATHTNLQTDLPESTIKIDDSLFERNSQSDLLLVGARADIQRSTFRDGIPEPGNLSGGYGIVLASNSSVPLSSSLTLKQSLLENLYGSSLILLGAVSATSEGAVIRGTMAEVATGLNGAGVYALGSDLGGRPSLTMKGGVVENNLFAGVAVYGADADMDGVVVRGTRGHDDGYWGYGLIAGWDDSNGTGSVVAVHNSRFDANQEAGLGSFSSTVNVEDSVIVDTIPRSSDGWGGVGVYVQSSSQYPTRGSLDLVRSLVARNQQQGVDLYGADATIDRCVIQDTALNSSSQLGVGVGVYHSMEADLPATAKISRSILQRNTVVGVHMYGASVSLDASLVEDTIEADRDVGNGVGVQAFKSSTDTKTTPSEIEILRSVIRKNRTAGVMALDSTLRVEDTVLEDTEPSKLLAADGGGFGMSAALFTDGLSPVPSVSLRGSMVRRNHLVGVELGVSGTIEGTVIRDGLPVNDAVGWGGGLDCESLPEVSTPVSLSLVGVLVENNQVVGLNFYHCTGKIQDTLVRDTLATAEGTYGDGISGENADVSIVSSSISGSARAGVSAFGARIGLKDTSMTCNTLFLDGELLHEDGVSTSKIDPPVPFDFDDNGGNECGCGNKDAECRVVSSELSPPGAVRPIPNSSKPPVQFDLSSIPPLNPFLS